MAQQKYFPFGGGIDVATPAITVPPGRLLTCLNFEPDFEGGYRRPPGYERFDGGPPPHKQTFTAFQVKVWIPSTFPYTLDHVVYANEAAWLEGYSDYLPEADADWLRNVYEPSVRRRQTFLMQFRDRLNVQERGLCHLVGVVDLEEEKPIRTVEKDVSYIMGVFRITGTMAEGQVVENRWVITTRPAERGEVMRPTADAWLSYVWEEYRAPIEHVPGAGHVRGAWLLGDQVYAWREDQRETETVAYKVEPVEKRETYIKGYLYEFDQDKVANPVRGSFTDSEQGTMWIEDGEGVGTFRSDDFSGEAARGVQTMYFHEKALTEFVSNPGLIEPYIRSMVPGDSIIMVPQSGHNKFYGTRLEYQVVSPPTAVTKGWRIEVGLISFRYDYDPDAENGFITPGSTDPEFENENWKVQFEAGILGKTRWEKVPTDRFCQVLRFDEGTADSGIPWKEGTEVTTDGGFSGTVHRLVDWAGGYGNDDAAGYVVLRAITGSIDNDDELKVSGTKVALANGRLRPFFLPAGSFLRFDQHNFFAGSNSVRLYGCNAKVAFELDENGYFSEIIIPTVADLTGFDPAEGSPDTPERDGLGDFIMPVAHGSILALALKGGRFITSVALQPLNFTSLLFAAEFGVGSEIVGMESLVGEVLSIVTERSAKALYGNSSEGWELRNISERQGSLLDSVKKVDDLYSLSWQGVTGLSRTEQFGDFASDTISNMVEPILKSLIEDFSTASVVRSANQYRMHFVRNQSHYEFGTFKLDAANVGLKSQPGAVGLTRAVAPGGEDYPNGVYRLQLPWKESMKYLESAAGGDTFRSNTDFGLTTNTPPTNRHWVWRENMTPGQYGNFIMTADYFIIAYNGSLLNWRRFWDRDGRMWPGTVIRVYSIQADGREFLAATFYVREEVDPTTIDSLRTVPLIKAFIGANEQNAELGTRLSDGTLVAGPFSLDIQVPPEIDDGENGVAVVRYRNVEHTYNVLDFRSGRGANPDTERTDCYVYLEPLSPQANHFLDTDQDISGSFELGLRTEDDAVTETLVMYVPEGNNASAERGTQTRERVEFGRLVYPAEINQIWECPTATTERIFFAGTDGFLYEDRVGTSHDGEKMVSFLRTQFIHLGMPSTRKRFRQIDLEVSSDYETGFQMVMDIDYADPQYTSLSRSDEEIAGRATQWDEPQARWGDFYWDGSLVSHSSIDVTGTGVNASFLFIFDGIAIQNLVMQGMVLQYTPRREER